MKKKALIIASVFSVFSTPSYALVCCVECDVAYGAAYAALGLSVSTSLAATYALLVDPLTIDLKTGMPTTFATILRQTQGTNSLESLKRINGIQDGLEAHKNSMITYHQQSELAKASLKAINEIPDAGMNGCSQYQLDVSSDALGVSRLLESTDGMNTLSQRSKATTQSVDALKSVKNAVTLANTVPYSGSVISRPGCKPVFDSAITAFETKTPVAIGWDCEGIPQTKTVLQGAEGETKVILSHILNPSPIPIIDGGRKKTFAGQWHEKEWLNYQAFSEINAKMGFDSLAKMLPTQVLEGTAGAMLEAHGVSAGNQLLSRIEVLSKWNEMRFDNPVDIQMSYGIPVESARRPDAPKEKMTPPSVPIPEMKSTPSSGPSSRPKLKAQLPASTSTKYDAQIVSAAAAAGVDAYQMKAHISVESNFKPDAWGHKVPCGKYPTLCKSDGTERSQGHAGGIGQFMWFTAEENGLSPTDPFVKRITFDKRFDADLSIKAMARYLSKLMRHRNVNGNLDLVSAAYISGPNGELLRRLANNADVIKYVPKIRAMREYFAMQGMSNAPPPTPRTDPLAPFDGFEDAKPDAMVEYEVSTDAFSGKLSVQTLRDIHVGQMVEAGLWLEIYQMRHQRYMVENLKNAYLASNSRASP